MENPSGEVQNQDKVVTPETVTPATSEPATPSAGIILPANTPAVPQAGLTAPGPSSPTNAAPAPRPGSFGSKFGDALRALGTKTNMSFGEIATAAGAHALSADAPAPSNVTWQQARTNADQTQPSAPPVGSAPVSNGQKAINALSANLGDVAAATEGGPAGGAIAGAARVLQAQTSRQRQEREDAIKMAHANAEMLHEQQLIHRTSEEAVESSAKLGLQSAQEMLSAPHAETLAAGKTSDELEELIRNKAIDPSRDAVFLTGRKLVGEDRNGLPMYRSTYTVVKPGDRIQPTKENLDFINKYTHSNYTLPDAEKGTDGQSFSSHDYYMINQRAMTNFANEQMIQKSLDDIEGKEHELKLRKNDYDFMNSSPVQAAINSVPHTGIEDPYLPVKAYFALMREAAANPDIRKQLPGNWTEQFAHAVGGGDIKRFESMVDKYSQIVEKNNVGVGGELGTMQKKLDDAKSPNEVISLQSSLDRMIDDAKKNPQSSQTGELQTLTNLKTQADRALKAMNDNKANESALETALKTGDPKEAAKLLVSRTSTISEMKSRGMTPDFVVKAIQEAQKLEPGYNAQKEDNFAKVAGSEQNVQFFGNVNSLIGENGTLDQLGDAAKNISQNDLKILNKITNWADLQKGDYGISQYAATAVGAADDYAKVMGGSVGSDTAREMVLKIIDPSLSPQQRQAAITAMVKAVWSQGEARAGKNPWLWSEYGDDLEKIRQKLGLPVRNRVASQAASQSAQATSQLNAQDRAAAGSAIKSLAGTPQQAPSTHVFDVKTWSAKHPGQNVQNAIDYAKQQGYTVINEAK